MSFFRLQVALGLLVAFHAFFVNALSSTLQEVTNFGANPTGVRMFLYKPTALANPPPLIIASHYCTGTAQAYFQGTQYAQLADNHGFIVIYPHAPDSGGCWDVHSSGTLTHDGGGDSLAIASMVRYAISNYGVDASRVFATGTSSGAMMTNVLLGAYPDLFKAGSLFAGVPYGCFEGPGMWNSQCSQGQLIKTPQQWGDQARSGYPGFTGQRPKVQFWHGTQDEILNAQNFQEQIKQWTNVFGVSQTPTSTETNSPVSILAQGVPHNIPVRENEVLAWFGLTNLTPGPGTGTPSSSSSSPGSTPTGNPPVGTVPHWGQCGGQGWTGGTVCVAPWTCQVSNPWYSQCL